MRWHRALCVRDVTNLVQHCLQWLKTMHNLIFPHDHDQCEITTALRCNSHFILCIGCCNQHAKHLIRQSSPHGSRCNQSDAMAYEIKPCTAQSRRPQQRRQAEQTWRSWHGEFCDLTSVPCCYGTLQFYVLGEWNAVSRATKTPVEGSCNIAQNLKFLWLINRAWVHYQLLFLLLLAVWHAQRYRAKMEDLKRCRAPLTCKEKRIRNITRQDKQLVR